jgi:hypothetical protein
MVSSIFSVHLITVSCGTNTKTASLLAKPGDEVVGCLRVMSDEGEKPRGPVYGFFYSALRDTSICLIWRQSTATMGSQRYLRVFGPLYLSSSKKRYWRWKILTWVIRILQAQYNDNDYARLQWMFFALRLEFLGILSCLGLTSCIVRGEMNVNVSKSLRNICLEEKKWIINDFLPSARRTGFYIHLVGSSMVYGSNLSVLLLQVVSPVMRSWLAGSTFVSSLLGRDTWGTALGMTRGFPVRSSAASAESPACTSVVYLSAKLLYGVQLLQSVWCTLLLFLHLFIS